MATEHLSWIADRRDTMVGLLENWAQINSGTLHYAGVATMADAVISEIEGHGYEVTELSTPAYQRLDDDGNLEEFPLGPTLSVCCRPNAERQVLLVIHFDTVYGADSTFQKTSRQRDRLLGPGVADAKGGLVVLWNAVLALERHLQDRSDPLLGWKILLNPDEEIGSPGSAGHLHAAMKHSDVGLLFEPSLPNHKFAAARKGSANFDVAFHGVSAHAGRHFDDGRNAVVAAAIAASALHDLNRRWPGVTLNVGKISGGGPANVVPDRAVIRINVRYSAAEIEGEVLREIERVMTQASDTVGVSHQLHGGFSTPPKNMTDSISAVFDHAVECGKSLGQEIDWEDTGGACDGNRLAGWGLPNVDTLGVRGGGIHSHDEFMIMDSLVERTQLVAEMLIRWADPDNPWQFLN